MTRILAATTLLLVLATAFVVSNVPSAQARENKQCSNATLSGTFGYSATGIVFDVPPPLAGPFSTVGRQTFDGQGNTDATATVSLNGNTIQVTIAGTYTVNPDCTGSFTIDISPVGLTNHVDFVIDDDGAEFRAINTDPGVVVTGLGRKQFSRGPKE